MNKWKLKKLNTTFKIDLQKMKIMHKLTKYVKDLCAKNYHALIKEIMKKFLKGKIMLKAIKTQFY